MEVKDQISNLQNIDMNLFIFSRFYEHREVVINTCINYEIQIKEKFTIGDWLEDVKYPHLLLDEQFLESVPVWNCMGAYLSIDNRSHTLCLHLINYRENLDDEVVLVEFKKGLYGPIYWLYYDEKEENKLNPEDYPL